MSERLPIELQLAAVVLAEELSFRAAADRLGTSPAVLNARIVELVTLLECPLFQEEDDKIVVTKNGQILIDSFRAFLAQRGKLQE